MSYDRLAGKKILVMAGGTGGHVFPALAVARLFHEYGAELSWLGTKKGIESRIIPQEEYIRLHFLSIAGLRGKGLLRKFSAPLMLSLACMQAAAILIKEKPNLVLGMGGFASGPGGLMARILGYPLVIHEQNAVAGLTNRLSSIFAKRVLQAFPHTFPKANADKYQVTGNPVRKEIVQLSPPRERFKVRGMKEEINILILGGSQGALVINEFIPQALAKVVESKYHNKNMLNIWHQAGKNKENATVALYRKLSLPAKVEAFIEDMALAYAWADLIVARAGALTVSEIQQAGVGAIFIPYPTAVDDHQTKNASFLASEGAAMVISQGDLDTDIFAELLDDVLDRDKLLQMAEAAKNSAPENASERVIKSCMEVMCA